MSGNDLTFYLQINFTSGIGDFYTYFCELYFLAKKLKEKNYKVCLLFNSIRKIDFVNLFEPEYYQYFDEIRLVNRAESISTLGNYKVIFPHPGWVTGQHCWEAFSPIDFEEILDMAYINLSRMGYLNITEYSNFPKLSKTYVEKTLKTIEKYNLDNFVVVHFRDLDDVGDTFNNRLLNNSSGSFNVREYQFEENFILSEKISLKLKSIVDTYSKVFLCSNNVRIKKYIKENYNNIISLDENLLSTINRDYSDKEYWEHCLIEFCITSFSKKIFLFTNYCWISNFISYGIVNNKRGVVNPYNTDNGFVEHCGVFMNL